LGILAVSGLVDPQSLLQYEFLGELGLTGELRPVAGALPAAIAAADAGRILVVPPGIAAEAALAEHADVRVARTLLECRAGLGNPRLLPSVERMDTTLLPRPYLAGSHRQARARIALQVGLAKPAIATHERFKIQRAVLLKTRKKLKRRISSCANSKDAE